MERFLEKSHLVQTLPLFIQNFQIFLNESLCFLHNGPKTGPTLKRALGPVFFGLKKLVLASLVGKDISIKDL